MLKVPNQIQLQPFCTLSPVFSIYFLLPSCYWLPNHSTSLARPAAVNDASHEKPRASTLQPRCDPCYSTEAMHGKLQDAAIECTKNHQPFHSTQWNHRHGKPPVLHAPRPTTQNNHWDNQTVHYNSRHKPLHHPAPHIVVTLNWKPDSTQGHDRPLCFFNTKTEHFYPHYEPKATQFATALITPTHATTLLLPSCLVEVSSLKPHISSSVYYPT